VQKKEKNMKFQNFREVITKVDPTLEEHLKKAKEVILQEIKEKNLKINLILQKKI